MSEATEALKKKLETAEVCVCTCVYICIHHRCLFVQDAHRTTKSKISQLEEEIKV